MINRRTVTKGIAWSVPVVAVAGAAPAFAVSSDGPLTLTGSACKLPGNSSVYTNGYVYAANLVNTLGPNPGDSFIVINSLSVNGVAQSQVGYKYLGLTEPGLAAACTTNTDCTTSVPDRIVLSSPDGSSYNLLIYSNNADNSANAAVVVSYTVYDCAAPGCTGVPYIARTAPNETPPATSGGGSCPLDEVFPLPPAQAYPGATRSASVVVEGDAAVTADAQVTEESSPAAAPVEESVVEAPPAETDTALTDEVVVEEATVPVEEPAAVRPTE